MFYKYSQPFSLLHKQDVVFITRMSLALPPTHFFVFTQSCSKGKKRQFSSALNKLQTWLYKLTCGKIICKESKKLSHFEILPMNQFSHVSSTLTNLPVICEVVNDFFVSEQLISEYLTVRVVGWIPSKTDLSRLQVALQQQLRHA